MIDCYQKISKIGHGAFANVYLVQEKPQLMQKARLFAMKIIPMDKVHLDVQAKILPKLDHPNIISTHQVFCNEYETILILQYASKGDLSAFIKKQFDRKQIPTKIIVEWLLQLCLGLQYIHSQLRIIHRDIKAKNILVMENGLLKVADFGVSRKLEVGEEFAATSIGTPECLSPEIIDLGKYDSKTDVWGLGCIMFELCTGNKPFHAQVLSELIKNIMNNQCGQIPESYPEFLRKLIKSMLEKNPIKRPTIEDILQNQELKEAFPALKEKYREQYRNTVYPIRSIPTTKNLDKEDRMIKIFTQSLKTVKNEKSIKIDIQSQCLSNDIQFLQTVKREQIPRKVQREKYKNRSLRSIISQSKRQKQKNQERKNSYQN